jgi:hypothetical protein
MSKSKKEPGLRKIMYHTGEENVGEPETGEDADGNTRINIRVSNKTLAWLKNEAADSGTTVSALASLAVYDWSEERKAKQNMAMNAAQNLIFEMLRKYEDDKKRYIDGK